MRPIMQSERLHRVHALIWCFQSRHGICIKINYFARPPSRTINHSINVPNSFPLIHSQIIRDHFFVLRLLIYDCMSYCSWMAYGYIIAVKVIAIKLSTVSYQYLRLHFRMLSRVITNDIEIKILDIQ